MHGRLFERHSFEICSILKDVDEGGRMKNVRLFMRERAICSGLCTQDKLAIRKSGRQRLARTQGNLADRVNNILSLRINYNAMLLIEFYCDELAIILLS